jgi:serine protease Do
MRALGSTFIIAAVSAVALFGVPRLIDSAEARVDRVHVHQASLRLSPDGGKNILEQFSDATRQVARRVRPSVVHITSAHNSDQGRRGGFEYIGTGSGWLWDDDGHVVTNWHVVRDADRIDVQLHDGELRSAELVGADPSTDIALLRIASNGLVGATRSPNFSEIEQGDLVFAFGSPLDFRFSMSSGLVSGLGRSAGIIGSRQQRGYEDFIQVDAAINPGNSGGPLTDARGRVIGMNTAIATRDEAADGTGRFNGIGLAIPLPMIESVIGQLISTGTVVKGFLGIRVAEPTEAMGLLGGGRRSSIGIVVATNSIEGLSAGDIIVQCNNERVSHESELQKVWTADDDGSVELHLIRHGTTDHRIQTVQLPSPWPNASDLLDPEDTMWTFFNQFGAPAGGVVVTICQADTPAEDCGLHVGDIILKINGRTIRSHAQLSSSISSVPPGQTIAIETWQWESPDGTTTRRATLARHPDR